MDVGYQAAHRQVVRDPEVAWLGGGTIYDTHVTTTTKETMVKMDAWMDSGLKLDVGAPSHS